MNGPGLESEAGSLTGRTQGLARSTAIMMAGLLLGKLTGQLREILIVPVFGGVGAITDAYIIGFQLPDLFFQLLVGGAIQAAVTPALSAALERNEERPAWRSISIFINAAAILMLAAAGTGMLLAPALVPLLNPGKPALTVGLAVQVSQMLFPQVFFMMMAALCIGILNAYRRFASTAFGPGFYNLCVIAAMVLLGSASAAGAVRTAAGVTAAALAYFLLQFAFARPLFRSYRPVIDWHDPGFRQLVRRAVPTLLSGSIVQVNTIVLNAFAFQFAGAATLLRQAATAWQLPYGIFTVAIGSVMLPSLSRHQAAGDESGSRQLLTASLRRALFLVIPVGTLFFCLPQETMAAIFQWGSSYTDAQTAMAAGILRFYCIALVAQTLVFLVNTAFYARGQTRVALASGLLSLFLNASLGYAFTHVAGLGVASLSLAYALASTASAGFLFLLYRRSWPAAAPRGIGRFLGQSALCALALAAAVLAPGLIAFYPAGKAVRLAWYLLRALIGFAAYLAAAFALRLPEARQLPEQIARLVRRRRRI